MNIMAGDIFLTAGPSELSKAIRLSEWIWSRDNSAIYNHAGIIISETGKTFEALTTIRESLLWAYRGKRVCIIRYTGYPVFPPAQAIQELINKYNGKIYPFWRLPLFAIFPPITKINILGIPVCSELVQKYRVRIGASPNMANGMTPDNIADEIYLSRNHTIVYEGVLA